jgi:putative ABC transport system permease protein
MGYLDRKMRRDLWRMKGRAIASVLLITMGSMLYVAFLAMMPSVQVFFYDFYDDSDFTDLEVYVGREPISVTAELQNIAGVEAVEPRLIFPANVRLKDSDEVSAQLFGINSSRELLVNRLTMVEGEYLNPSYPDEVLLEKNFAINNDYGVGDNIEVFTSNQSVTYRIRGIAVSPEFMFWAINPQAMIPLPGTLAVIFMPLESLQQLAPIYQGAVNQFSFLLEEGSEEVAQTEIVTTLSPYLVLAKEDIPAYTYIKEDLEQGGGSAGAMAFIFLLVAFFVVYSAYARLVASQRREIGVLRGLGYSRKRILFSYIYIAAITGLIGSVIGVLISIPLGFGLSEWYVDLVFGLKLETVFFNMQAAIEGILFGPITAGLAAAVATIRIIRLEAHEAIRGSTVDMKPVKKTALERIFGVFRGKKLSYPTIYMSRNLSRRRIRSALLVLAIGGSFVLGAMGPLMLDSLVISVDLALDDIEEWDLLVEFAPNATAADVNAMSSDQSLVEDTESVQRLGGTLHLNGESMLANIVGIQVDSQLHNPKIVEGREFAGATEAMVTSLIANEIGADVGDTIVVEVEEGVRWTFTIVGITQDFLEGFYVSSSATENIAGSSNVTALYVSTVDGRMAEAESHFRSFGIVSSVTEKSEVSQGLKDLLYSFGAAMYIFSLLGILMTVLVVTNVVMISVMERYVEYGQMKAIGYKQKTIRRIVLSETMILASLGVVVGIPLYWLVGEWFAVIMEEFFSFYQNVITWQPLLAMGIVTIIVALLATVPAVRHLKKMEVATVISERQFG